MLQFNKIFHQIKMHILKESQNKLKNYKQNQKEDNSQIKYQHKNCHSKTNLQKIIHIKEVKYNSLSNKNQSYKLIKHQLNQQFNPK